jgi:outer membrane receptor protein involved in Fe transport
VGRELAWCPDAVADRPSVEHHVSIRAHPSGLPIVIDLRGNPEFSDQTVVEHEIGYRLSLGSAATFDAAAFTARYDGLRTSEPLTPQFETTPSPHIVTPMQFANLLDATTSGVEIVAQWQPVRVWRLEGSYTAFHLTPRVDPASLDLAAASADGRTPTQQWRVRSA